jgi:hypothetical protein
MLKKVKELIFKRRQEILKGLKHNCEMTDYQRGQLDLIKELSTAIGPYMPLAQFKTERFNPVEDAKRFLRLSR